MYSNSYIIQLLSEVLRNTNSEQVQSCLQNLLAAAEAEVIIANSL